MGLAASTWAMLVYQPLAIGAFEFVPNQTTQAPSNSWVYDRNWAGEVAPWDGADIVFPASSPVATGSLISLDRDWVIGSLTFTKFLGEIYASQTTGTTYHSLIFSGSDPRITVEKDGTPSGKRLFIGSTLYKGAIHLQCAGTLTIDTDINVNTPVSSTVTNYDLGAHVMSGAVLKTGPAILIMGRTNGNSQGPTFDTVARSAYAGGTTIQQGSIAVASSTQWTNGQIVHGPMGKGTVRLTGGNLYGLSALTLHNVISLESTSVVLGRRTIPETPQQLPAEIGNLSLVGQINVARGAGVTRVLDIQAATTIGGTTTNSFISDGPGTALPSSIKKKGPATLTLAGTFSNSFAGRFTVENGLVVVRKNDALGAIGTSSDTVVTGGTLQLAANYASAETVTLVGRGVVTDSRVPSASTTTPSPMGALSVVGGTSLSPRTFGGTLKIGQDKTLLGLFDGAYFKVSGRLDVNSPASGTKRLEVRRLLSPGAARNPEPVPVLDLRSAQIINTAGAAAGGAGNFIYTPRQVRIMLAGQTLGSVTDEGGVTYGTMAPSFIIANDAAAGVVSEDEIVNDFDREEPDSEAYTHRPGLSIEGGGQVSSGITFADDLPLNIETVTYGAVATLNGPIDNAPTAPTPVGTVDKFGPGTLQIARFYARGLFVNEGAVSIAPSGSNATTSRLSLVGVSNGGRLDLNDNDLVIDYETSTPSATVQALLVSGYGPNKDWTGNGITSSTAAVPANLAMLGIAEASAIGVTTFSGQTVDSTTVLVKYTYRGDADLSGVTDFWDLLKVSANYNTTGKVWTDGDGNYDGAVNFDDLLLLASAYNLTPGRTSQLGGAEAVYLELKAGAPWILAEAAALYPDQYEAVFGPYDDGTPRSLPYGTRLQNYKLPAPNWWLTGGPVPVPEPTAGLLIGAVAVPVLARRRRA
jgi:autotransporter-associated beta strand protein